MDPVPDAVGAIATRKATSLRAIVQRELERTILAGDLAGGERVNEQQIAKSLGVSSGPVREARAEAWGSWVTMIIVLP